MYMTCLTITKETLKNIPFRLEGWLEERLVDWEGILALEFNGDGRVEAELSDELWGRIHFIINCYSSCWLYQVADISAGNRCDL
jgi:hypothetical protein